MTLKAKRLIGGILLFGLVVITAFVTPWNNLEPVSKPKLALLTLVVALSGLVASLFFKFPPKFPNIFEICTLAAILITLLNLLINHQFYAERVFGVQGRNFGALTLFSLLVLSIIASNIADGIQPSRALIAIKLSSNIVATYFLIQLAGFDRANWVEAYDGVVPTSTLGNPNFVSAFVAIGFVSTLPLLFAKEVSLRQKGLILMLSVLELLVAVKSNSFQGLAIMGFGIVILLLGLFKSVILRFKLRKVHLTMILAALAFVVTLEGARLRRVFSVDGATIRARLDYWDAGIAMGIDSPFFGRGFDFFGESYLRYRSESAASRSTAMATDSAHNYFIDLFAFGGLPLFLATLLPFLLVVLGKIQSLRISKDFNRQSESVDVSSQGLFLALLGFLFQALISPFCIPLAYLGFLLVGYIYGSSKSIEVTVKGYATDRVIRSAPSSHAGNSTARKVIFRASLASVFLSIPALGIQPMILDAKFRDGIERGNAGIIYEMALRPPKSFRAISYAAEIFLQNNREDLARPLILELVTQNPENIVGWRLFDRVSRTDSEKAKARAKILALDPKNPQLRKS